MATSVLTAEAWTTPKQAPVTTVTRRGVQAAAERVCSDADVSDTAVLLTGNTTYGATAVLRFNGSAITVYGAVLSLQHLKYEAYIDQELPSVHTFPTPGCRGSLVQYSGLDPAVEHRLWISNLAFDDSAPYVAIYNATITNPPASQSSSSTVPSSSSESTPSQSAPSPSSSKAAQTIPQGPNVTDVASPASTGTSSKSVRVVALIAAPVIVALLVLFVLVWYLRRRRRNRHLRHALPGEELLRPYPSTPMPMTSGGTLKHPDLAVTITPATNSSTFAAPGPSSPRDAKYQALNLKPPPASPSEMPSTESMYSNNTSSASTPLLPGGSGPEDVAALEAAVRRAGFSISSVVASLNRLSISQSQSQSAYAPTESEAPPLYERRIGNGR
ncbi:hypothetical protein EXIGLDRAFT_832350 [Exidia glandulosa HHB12029]|uniref:Mid2 domain-containing protein n=1 Tax=Exidia glandulosa HHB12029 TaxID=1314781 RepID=A0A165LSK7_EXIGL|nr:hypothetical protein EXIGLDRAFT_832350 [Exidia glandulosa HHB12029]